MYYFKGIETASYPDGDLQPCTDCIQMTIVKTVVDWTVNLGFAAAALHLTSSIWTIYKVSLPDISAMFFVALEGLLVSSKPLSLPAPAEVIHVSSSVDHRSALGVCSLNWSNPTANSESSIIVIHAFELVQCRPSCGRCINFHPFVRCDTSTLCQPRHEY